LKPNFLKYGIFVFGLILEHPENPNKTLKVFLMLKFPKFLQAKILKGFFHV